MRAALSLEAIYAIPPPTWRALFTALGAPPPADDHAAIAASLAGDLPAPLARALFVIEAFATEAARSEIYAAAAALDPTALLPSSTSPADLIAQLLAAAPRDPAIAAILDAAKILRSRQYPPRTTYVFLLSSTASNGSDAAIGDPSQYADAWTAAAKSWCTETGRGHVVSVSTRTDRACAIWTLLHEDRTQTRLCRGKRGITADVARPLRSKAPRLSITTCAPDAAIPLAQMAGAILFDDARAFLRESPFTLRPLQARGAAALDVATAGGELASLRAISGTWHSGKNHAVTPRGQSFFEALERYKIRIDGGRLEAVTLRASLRPRDGSPTQCDVAIRPPHLLTLSNPESAPLMTEVLDLARITRADEPVLDFFSIQPWIQTRAGWTASVGDAFDALVKEGVLLADKQNRAVAHPDYPYAGRVFVAFPLADGRWLATNPDVPIAPFVCSSDDLVVYRLSFEKLAAKIADTADATRAARRGCAGRDGAAADADEHHVGADGVEDERRGGVARQLASRKGSVCGRRRGVGFPADPLMRGSRGASAKQPTPRIRAHPHALPSATTRQNKFTNFICATLLTCVRASRGLPTTIAKLSARDSATFNRFGFSKNSIPRGVLSPELAHIETITTAASCP